MQNTKRVFCHIHPCLCYILRHPFILHYYPCPYNIHIAIAVAHSSLIVLHSPIFTIPTHSWRDSDNTYAKNFSHPSPLPLFQPSLFYPSTPLLFHSSTLSLFHPSIENSWHKFLKCVIILHHVKTTPLYS